MKKMTQAEYLTYWNKLNPRNKATIDQIERCECGFPKCEGWICYKKYDKRSVVDKFK